MTCKENCIHSGLCYKENDYDNFPDRCGDFISNKVLEKRPQGTWLKHDTWDYSCSICEATSTVDDGIVEDLPNFCPNCGAKMQRLKGEEE